MLNNIDSYVGKKLKEKRKKFGLTQTELSKQVGISFQQIQKYETGQNRISASMLFKMSNILKVKLDYFFPTKNQLLATEEISQLNNTQANNS